MSTFLTSADYSTRVSDRVLNLLTGENYILLDQYTGIAIGKLTDRLTDKYAIAAELAKSGTNRNVSLVEYALSLAVYALYSRIPDEEIPERVIKDYDDANRELEQIQKGNLSCTLTLNIDSEGVSMSSFRMGNNNPRTHDPFS